MVHIALVNYWGCVIMCILWPHPNVWWFVCCIYCTVRLVCAQLVRQHGEGEAGCMVLYSTVWLIITTAGGEHTLLQVLRPYSASMTGWHNTKPSGERNLFSACMLSKDIITIGFFRWYQTFPMISDISEKFSSPALQQNGTNTLCMLWTHTQVISTRSSLHCLLRFYLCTTRASCI